jgi:hypothetical protein
MLDFFGINAMSVVKTPTLPINIVIQIVILLLGARYPVIPLESPTVP